MAELCNSRQILRFVKGYKTESIIGGKSQAIFMLCSVLQFREVIWSCPH